MRLHIEYSVWRGQIKQHQIQVHIYKIDKRDVEDNGITLHSYSTTGPFEFEGFQCLSSFMF